MDETFKKSTATPVSFIIIKLVKIFQESFTLLLIINYLISDKRKLINSFLERFALKWNLLSIEI